jgi:hypothetical protein
MVVGGGLKESGTDLIREKLWENEITHMFLVGN